MPEDQDDSIPDDAIPIGQYDLRLRDVTEGRWLKPGSIDLGIETVDGDVHYGIVAAELEPRVTFREMSVVAQAGEEAGLFEHRSYEDYGESDDPGKYIHQYRVDGTWHDELHYEYRPGGSRYGSVIFYVSGPRQA